jgi:hypothetical protein
LDGETRQLMIEEIELDLANGRLYLSSYLSPIGRIAWPGILLEAAKGGDDETAIAGLSMGNNFRSHVEKRVAGGGTTTAKVPYTAAATFAGCEFNVYYHRALARRAIDNGWMLEVYRAKASSQPRRESALMVGKILDPKVVLNDLRKRANGQSQIGFAQPNSGLTVRLVEIPDAHAANDNERTI